MSNMLPLKKMSFFIFVLAFLQYSTGSKKDKDGSEGDDGGPQDLFFSVPSFASPSPYHPGKGFPKSKTFMPLKPNEAAFSNAFMKGVKSSDLLSKVFDLSDTTGLDFGKFFYSYASYWFDRWGYKNPKIPAEFVGRSVAQNFYNIPLDTMLRAISSAYGRFLNEVGTYDDTSPQKLAADAIPILEESAKNTYDGTSHSKLESLGMGFVKFLNTDVHMDAEKVRKFAIHFANAYLEESINYGPGDCGS